MSVYRAIGFQGVESQYLSLVATNLFFFLVLLVFSLQVLRRYIIENTQTLEQRDMRSQNLAFRHPLYALANLVRLLAPISFLDIPSALGFTKNHDACNFFFHSFVSIF